ncbi:hypothetical protein NVP1244A_057 [Vibrio phage 1.244.A._10N.261.54.C3]|nr:hypothetical protein NVP1244A_057 [Vibrio phage 1.244.A._10N.261.54.C3]AUR98685.1 hypothetical protein NVP1255O_057 [Vibrio phage 1.255.O._10N.286.45.F1]
MLKLKPIWFIGTIENVNDETKSGLVQVRVLGVHASDKALLPTEYLPWGKLMLSPTSASNNGIGRSPTGVINGSMCFGFSLDAGYTDIKITSTWHSKTDVHILARNNNPDELKASVVGHKIDALEKGVPTFDSSWDEPANPYNAKYPYNDVTVSMAGHVFETDNTPDHERLHWLHKSGTFQEIHPDGSRVLKVIGDDVEMYLKGRNLVVKGNCNVTVLGNADVFVKGNKREKIGGDLIQEVAGDLRQKVGGSRIENIVGDDTKKAGGVINRTAGGNINDSGANILLN